MAATAPPPLPHYLAVKLSGACTLEFSDGNKYTFSEPALLIQAQNVEQMGRLQQVGELQMRCLTYDSWRRSGNLGRQLLLPRQYIDHQLTDQADQWETLFDGAMEWKSYRAWIADRTGVSMNIMMKGGMAWSANTLAEEGNFVEKAGGVEALLGAVWEDSGRDLWVTKEVMRRVGVYWPETPAELSQLTAVVLKLRKSWIITI